jgi:hypothetical protein
MVGGFLIGLVIGLGLAGVVALRWSRRSAASAMQLRRRANSTQSELELVKERARRLEGALDLVGEGIVVVDGDGRRLFTNAAAGLLTDARHEEALVAGAVDQALAEALEGRTVEQGVELFGPPTRQVTVAASPLGPSGARLGAVVLVRDESRLRRLEAIRQEFVANVSHELKTPIGATCSSRRPTGSVASSTTSWSWVRSRAGTTAMSPSTSPTSSRSPSGACARWPSSWASTSTSSWTRDRSAWPTPVSSDPRSPT